MQKGRIYFKQFLFMQDNLNNNIVLMHIDAAVIVSKPYYLYLLQ